MSEACLVAKSSSSVCAVYLLVDRPCGSLLYRFDAHAYIEGRTIVSVVTISLYR